MSDALPHPPDPPRPPPLPRGRGYWLRWILLLPAVGNAFVLAGIAGVLTAVLSGHERIMGLFAGPLCAFAWVLTTRLVAPSHKRLAPLIAYGIGLVAAWPMIHLAEPRVAGLTFALTAAGGLLALLPAPIATAPRAWLAAARRLITASSLAEACRIVRMFANPKESAMQEPPTLHQLLKRHVWLRLIVVAVVLIGGAKAALTLGRAAVDIVPQDHRGLYLRLGRYVRTLDPGLHVKVPVIDTIVGVSVKERQGYIQHVDAMTQDNVIMSISLQYTYEVTDPRRYRLEVEAPDTIIKEFVQGKLRDIVNTISMNDLMRKRMDLGERITADLASREHDFGIHFKLVQVQGAYPPPEVQEAIKQSMVTEQRTVAAKEEATQKQILADAMLYEAERQTEAARHKIEETAKAQKESIRLLLEELDKHEALGQKYMEYLITQELKDNSKWIIAGSAAPQIHLETKEN